jgi:hypothetical protein
MCRKTAQQWTRKSRRHKKMRQKCDMFPEEKKILGGAAPNPCRGAPYQGGPPPSNPPAPPMQHVADTRASRAKNITHTQHSPTCCFLCIQGVTGLHSQQSREKCPWILYTKRTSQCSQILLMNLQHSSKCPPSSTTLSFLQPCLSQSDIEYQYALSLNDKSGSSPEKLHSDCHNLSLQLVVPTQYLNTIFCNHTCFLTCMSGCHVFNFCS